MAPRLANQLAKKFDEEVRFFKTWVDKPKALGAILPTSGITAKRMASLSSPESGNPVLELGPGTGVITKAILEQGIKPENLYTVEFTEEFIDQLKSDFPHVNVLQGDAFDLESVLPDLKGKKFDSVISALPLLNFPVSKRVELLNDLFDRLEPGHPVIQISYGPVSPIPPDWETFTVESLDWIVRNVPPARLWVYRRIVAPC
ncbi:MAG: methyltransferase domain-containing protein [Rhizobiaceae bacterium]